MINLKDFLPNCLLTSKSQWQVDALQGHPINLLLPLVPFPPHIGVCQNSICVESSLLSLHSQIKVSFMFSSFTRPSVNCNKHSMSVYSNNCLILTLTRAIHTSPVFQEKKIPDCMLGLMAMSAVAFSINH